MTITIDHHELAALRDLWGAQPGADHVPERSAFTPEALRPWLGHIGIVEVERAPVRLKVRLAGMHLVDHDGADNTGRYLHDVIPPARHELVLGSYLRCLDTKQPQYELLYSRPAGTKRFLMRRLLLPVSVDGRDVDQIIAGIYTEAVPLASQ